MIGAVNAVVDVDDIEAGQYELVALRWDQITSRPGEPLDFVRHRRGDILDLNVEDARRLVVAGAVTKPGEEYEPVGSGQSVAPGEPVQDEAPTPVEPVIPATPEDNSPEAVLAAVGSDKGKATAALALEQSKGARARKPLMAKLQTVIDAPSGS